MSEEKESKVIKGGVICNSEASLNHHYDTLKPDTVIDVKDLSDDDLVNSMMFVKDTRTLVITQLTSQKADYMIENFDSLFSNKKIVNLYFDPYNDVYGMSASLLMSAMKLGECCKTMTNIMNAYFIIREGTYCRIN